MIYFRLNKLKVRSQIEIPEHKTDFCLANDVRYFMPDAVSSQPPIMILCQANACKINFIALKVCLKLVRLLKPFEFVRFKLHFTCDFWSKIYVSKYYLF